jgi:hypothetical protein
LEQLPAAYDEFSVFPAVDQYDVPMFLAMVLKFMFVTPLLCVGSLTVAGTV